MRELYSHPAFRLPYLRRFSAVTLAPFWILYRDGPAEVDPVTRRHEAEHLAQGRRVGLLIFYGTYLLDWIRGLARTRSLDAAYRQIRWEVEAYAAQHEASWPPECPDLPPRPLTLAASSTKPSARNASVTPAPKDGERSPTRETASAS